MSLATFLNDAIGIWRHQPSADSAGELGPSELAQMPPDTRRLIRNRRYAVVLSRENEVPFDDVSAACAWKMLEHEMALVPGGETYLLSDTFVLSGDAFEAVTSRGEPTPVESLYLDRCCVSNADYAKFVQSGGYSQDGYWPEAILPSVLQFVDSTGHPGPKYWSQGSPPPHKLDHPVVGVCWYEANAYAAWAGKRLPTPEQWQRAGTWPRGHGRDSAEPRYPWGNAFDPSKANTWASRCGDTVPVDAFAAGNTPNGVRQLIGNVWQWVDAQFYPDAQSGLSVHLDESMAEVRGGAFDSYFHTQATCQFRSGQPVFFRGPNVGFRCCISAGALLPPAGPFNPTFSAGE